jgi:divalent metal cation (Fe/Co/Zn/Cd) transporter
MLSFIISTIVFFVASFVLHRYLEEWGLDKGMGRTLLVLMLASVISYGAMSLMQRITGEQSLWDRVITTEVQLGEQDGL